EVVAVVEHRAGPLHVAIEAARDADRPALDPACQRDVAAGLADQVDMVALDRELADAELEVAIARPAAAMHERALQDLGKCEAAQPGDTRTHTLGHVHRKPRFDDRTRLVT